MTIESLRDQLGPMRREWGWLLALGIGLVVLGAIALGAAWLVTLASVVVFGWLVLFGGVLESVTAFRAREHGGFFLHLLGGVLGVVVGVLMIANPVAGALALTLLLGSFFLVGGFFRIAVAAAARVPHRGWGMLAGAVSVLLGVMVLDEWPGSAVWLIGTYVAIELILRGSSWVALALDVRRLPPAGDVLIEPPVGRRQAHPAA